MLAGTSYSVPAVVNPDVAQCDAVPVQRGIYVCVMGGFAPTYEICAAYD